MHLLKLFRTGIFFGDLQTTVKLCWNSLICAGSKLPFCALCHRRSSFLVLIPSMVLTSPPSSASHASLASDCQSLFAECGAEPSSRNNSTRSMVEFCLEARMIFPLPCLPSFERFSCLASTPPCSKLCNWYVFLLSRQVRVVDFVSLV